MTSTLPKKQTDVNQGTLFVGVDLAMDRNMAIVINEQAQRLDRIGFSNNREGYDYLYHRLQNLTERHGSKDVLIGMEPTNYFWKLLAADLEQHQIRYRLVNAYTVKKHREGDQLDRSKDDPRDGFTIAELLRAGKYTKTQLLHDAYADLRTYAALYRRLQGDIGRQKTLVRVASGQLFPELNQVFKDFSGKTAQAMMRNHATASVIKAMSLEEFIARVRSDFHGQRLNVSKLRQAHELAANSVGLKDGIQALQDMLRIHMTTLHVLLVLCEQVRQALEEIFLALPEAKYMLSIHGLGLTTAALVLAEIGNPLNYTNAQQWIKLAGTQPVMNISGRRKRSKTPMSHKGRSRLRTALFYACLRLVQVDEVFAYHFQRFQQRDNNPLTKMEALGALMNRLLRLLWALIKNQTLYNPAPVPTA